MKFRQPLLGSVLLIVSTTTANCTEQDLALQACKRQPIDDVEIISTELVSWKATDTAAVVCDMWDQHWCKGATRRVAEMAPRMNRFLNELRSRGVLIIHCPSSCLEHYEGSVQRKLATSAPAIDTERKLETWCHLDKEREGALPIDDSDGGCDCQPRCKSGSPWKRQIASIEIKDGDAIADDPQAFYLMKKRGIKNVLVMGVHTNMCVLGRPFSIRQLVYQGQNVMLVRDMTDTMYNSRSAPFVSHFTGTDLVVEHIERNWCPTVTSADILGGKPFRFKNDTRKRIAVVMGEDEYDAKKTLPRFAKEELGKHFQVHLVHADPTNKNSFPQMSVLNDCDVALIGVRRRAPTNKQMAALRKFVADGKPIAAIRTTSHAFHLRGKDAPEGHELWEAFDREVLGCNYQGHYGNKGPDQASTMVWPDPKNKSHEILAEWPSGDNGKHGVRSWLYKHTPLAETATPLLLGQVGNEEIHPVAWTNERPGYGKVFYTMMGHPDEFQKDEFKRLLKRGVYWAAGLDLKDAKLAKATEK